MTTQRPARSLPRHAPAGYACPFCAFVRDHENGLLDRQDLIEQDRDATAFVAPHWWPNNPRHVLVVSNAHVENVYEAEDRHLTAVSHLVRDVAIAIRATYGCTGTSVRQHNEPDGNQDVWHFHVHVFPRYPGDRLYVSKRLPGAVSPNMRRGYAEKLRTHFAESSR